MASHSSRREAEQAAVADLVDLLSHPDDFLRKHAHDGVVNMAVFGSHHRLAPHRAFLRGRLGDLVAARASGVAEIVNLGNTAKGVKIRALCTPTAAASSGWVHVTAAPAPADARQASAPSGWVHVTAPPAPSTYSTPAAETIMRTQPPPQPAQPQPLQQPQQPMSRPTQPTQPTQPQYQGRRPAATTTRPAQYASQASQALPRPRWSPASAGAFANPAENSAPPATDDSRSRFGTAFEPFQASRNNDAKLAEAAQTIARLELEKRQLKQRVQTLQHDNTTLTAQLHLYTTIRTPEELARATKAACALQRYTRGMLTRRRMSTYRERFAELAAIETELGRLKERRWPAIFSQSYVGENGRPRFAALEYEEAHTKLLIRIDAVASEGQDSIRARRKRLTAATNAALEELDQYRTAVPVAGHDAIPPAVDAVV